jgi:hypothetical protein
MFVSGNDEINPSRLTSLSESERLLVCSYRRWIVGMRTREETHWALVWREVSCIFGVNSVRSVLGGLQSIIAGIVLHARRPLRLHPPCCGYICTDEFSIIALIGACQRRDYRTARGITEWLVRADGMSGVLEGAGRIAKALSKHRLYLPDRSLRHNEQETSRSGRTAASLKMGALAEDASTKSQECSSAPALFDNPTDFAEWVGDRL